MKIKPTQKVTYIVRQLPTNCDQGTNKLGQVTNIYRNIIFALFFKFLFFEVLLNFSNLQTGAFG